MNNSAIHFGMVKLYAHIRRKLITKSHLKIAQVKFTSRYVEFEKEIYSKSQFYVSFQPQCDYRPQEIPLFKVRHE